MRKYYEILGLKEGATKQEIRKAFNKLSKDLDPKNNDNQEFFVEETKKLIEAYDKLMNSSILSNKKINENKQTDNSQNNNNKSDKENNTITSNDKSNFMKYLKEISVAILSIAMIKVLTQIFVFPKAGSGKWLINFESIFDLTVRKTDYKFSFQVFVFSVLLYLFLRCILQMRPEIIITKTFYVFIATMLFLKIGYAVYTGG